MRAQLKQLQVKLEDDSNAKAALDAIAALDKKAAELVAVEQTWPPVGVVSVASLNGSLGTLISQVDSADSAPTTQATAAFAAYNRLLEQLLAKWEALKAKDLPALNVILQQRQLPAITIKDLSTSLAALPLDVRKGYDLPEVVRNSLGLRP